MATIDLGKIKLVWKGTYNNSTAYTVDDLVEYTDTGITSTYICVANSTGNAPSSGGTAHASWNYVAKGVVDPIPSQSGNAGKVLKTDGTNLSFGTGGGVVQTQIHKLEPPTQVSSSSTTWIGTGLTKAITPTSASNKIKISANLLVWMDSLGGSPSGGKGIEGQLRITRDDGSATTELAKMEVTDWHGIAKYPITFDYWDTAYNTTNACTYVVETRRRAIYSGNNSFNCHHSTTYNTIATLTLTEYAV